MRKNSIRLLLIPLFCQCLGGLAEGCAGCWAGYGPGDERYNKPLADLRILYEKEGKAALPAIEDALVLDRDHLVKQRAVTYIAEIKDSSSIPVLEGMIAELYKKVTFGNFGVGTPDSQTRLKVAHVLASMGPGDTADRIWSRYDRLDGLKKSEVPYLLNALSDPQLYERLLEILRQGRDHFARNSLMKLPPASWGGLQFFLGRVGGDQPLFLLSNPKSSQAFSRRIFLPISRASSSAR